MADSARCPHCGATVPATAGCTTCGWRPQETTGALSPTAATLARWAELAADGASSADTLRGRPLPPGQRPTLQPRAMSVAAAGADTSGADLELQGMIGRGGMGVVHAARQTSLDRVVALKTLAAASDQAEARERFIAEAAVIGTLDHPNIVPIHELGVTATGEVFYTMKRVQGVPWNQVIDTRSIADNLETLLRVGDAVAFAHAHGVIHRDLKPHNVMLGDFGEVLVLDWGLALRVDGDTAAASAIGGTAAYMPPEMALGAVDKISFASDIYLLGAILFEVITGRRPHPGASAVEALAAAAANHIVDCGEDGELLSIARRAMATNPGDRHASVQELQSELRAHLAHSQSLLLGGRALASLDAARRSRDYGDFSRACFGFEQSLELWPDNREAVAGLRAARVAYARCALEREDLDLADSLLPTGATDEAPLRDELGRARRRRDHRRRRILILTRTAQGLAAALILSLATGLALVSRERDRVARAEQVASAQRNLALGTLDTLVYEVDQELRERPGMQNLRQRVLDRAIDGLQELVADTPHGGAVDRKLAAAHQSLASIFHAARRNDLAVDHQRRAVEILESLDRLPRQELAAAYKLQGDIVHNYKLGDLAGARAAYLRARELLTAAGRSDPTLDLRQDTAGLELALGDTALDQHDLASAGDSYRRAADLAAELADEAPGELAPNLLVVSALLRRGDAAYAGEQLELSERCYAEALQRSDELAGAHPGNLETQRNIGIAATSLAELRGERGDVAGALALFDRARAALRALVAADASNGQYQRDLLATLCTRGTLVRDQGQPASALADFAEAAAIAERLLALNPSNSEARRDLFICCNRLGDCHLALARTAAAMREYRRGLELSAAVAAEQPGNVGAQTDQVVSLYKIGDAARTLGDCAEAVAHWRRGLAILDDLAADGRLDAAGPFAAWPEELRRLIADCSDARP